MLPASLATASRCQASRSPLLGSRCPPPFARSTRPDPPTVRRPTRKCSANAFARRGLSQPINQLGIRTVEDEYKRNGTANLFIFLDVHRPWRKVKLIFYSC